MINLNDMQDWIKLVKEQKQVFCNSDKGSNIPPTLFVEKNNNLILIVIAPEMDKELLFRAAHICRKGLAADAFVAVFDAHMALGDAKKESSEEFTNKFLPSGTMARMAREGACEKGLITDCLICHRIKQDKSIVMATIPYREVFGRVEWKDNDINILDEKEKGVQVEGTIPEVLRHIMDSPTFVEDAEVQRMAKLCGVDAIEDQIRHITRACVTILEAQGYFVSNYME